MQSLLSIEHREISEALSQKKIDIISSPESKIRVKKMIDLASREDEYLHQILVTYCDSDYEATDTVETNASDRGC